MALLTISGEPASRWEEAAHGAARLLQFELITETRLQSWMTESSATRRVPHRAWKPAVVSIVARMATVHHLVVALPGAELLFATQPILMDLDVRRGVAPRRRAASEI